MSPYLQAAADWRKRNFAWSNDPLSWIEIIFGLALLLGLGVLWFLGWFGLLPALVEVLSWALFALTGIVFSLWLSGPILLYDLVSLARRTRYFFLRCLYASLLA